MLMGLGRSRRSLRARVAQAGAGVGLALGLAGCHGFGRGAATPNRPLAATLGTARAALAPATLAISIPPEMAFIDPDHSEVGTTTPVSRLDPAVRPAEATAPAPPTRPEPNRVEPTPLLDAALLKARQQGSLPDEPGPALAPAPVEVAQPAAPIVPAGLAPAPAPEAAALPVVLPPSEIPTPTPAPEAKPAEPTAEAKPANPEDAWRDGIRRLVGLARARQDQGAAGPGDPWGLRARVLAWLAEPDIDPDLGPRDTDGVRSVLRALAATAAGPSSPAQLRGDEVRAAVRTLEAQAPLELVDLRLCQEVNGFGDYAPVDASRLRAGQQVVVYVEVDGVRHELTPRGYHSHLAGRREIAPERGGPAIALPLDPAEETSERRRRDYYVNYLLNLPRDLAPGAYTLRVTLKDMTTEQGASRAIPFRIVADDRPAPAEPSPALAPSLGP